MKKDNIPYLETGVFSSLILDYLAEKKEVKPFYHRFPQIEQFEAQIQEKQHHYSQSTRQILHKALVNQNSDLELSEVSQKNLTALKDSNTFTITTGHQLNLFSGPLYFVYKIITVLDMCKQLKQKYPTYHFVPMYWMATEDHDFEEIQYFHFKKNKIDWNNNKAGGPVGRLSTEGLEEVFQKLSSLLNTGKNAQYVKNLFRDAYLKHNTLSAATRFLVNELFGKHGVLVIDGDHKELKKEFQSYAVTEIDEQTTFNNVSETNTLLKSKQYHVQVNPREINLFYMNNQMRRRIVSKENKLEIDQTPLSFQDTNELLSSLDHETCLSGNALLRPLYQEIILPNLCYVGGGGEIAYWLQLKSTFKAFQVPFPMLKLRNSALQYTNKQKRKLEKLKLSPFNLFSTTHHLSKKIVENASEISFDFEQKKNMIQSMFTSLEVLSSQTDPSFIGAVKAQEKKQLKGIEHLEKRWLKAEKRRLKDHIDRALHIKAQLFPKDSLQERHCNFSEFVESYDLAWLEEMITLFNGFDDEFYLIELR